MEQSPKPGTEFHQSSVYLPDMRLALQSPTHQSYQFICGQGFVISHVVDTTPHLLSQQSFHHIAKIVYRSKRPSVLKGPQRPGNAFPHHIIKKIQIAFVAPYGPTGAGTTSSVSISPTTLSAAAFTELKNTNFFADDSRKKLNIFWVNPVLISK